MDLKYRADIDGLRAIAVLAVLLFHSNIPGFSGGFVGVDIFFVISGYLISSVIIKELQEGKFSVARFYERRIRRIFPALFPLFAFVLMAGAFLLDMNAFKELGSSLRAATLFGYNIQLWHESGYFDAPSLQKPLLHTWSLGVEEQFYIFFPLALLLISRYLQKKYLPWVWTALILSLAGSLYGLRHWQSATFYLVPTRAWEFMVGSLISLGFPAPVLSPRLNNAIAFTGLLLIILSITLYSESTPFPGLAALPPVLGSGMIIYSGKNTQFSMVRKMLSLRPLVFTGLISYSLYLWHWPFIAFWNYLHFRPRHIYENLLLITASFVFAIFSWRFIERPFRGKSPLFPARSSLFAVSAALMLLFIAGGSTIILQNGMPWRYPEANQLMEQGDWQWYKDGTYGKLEQNERNIAPNILGNPSGKPVFALWGDSHAMTLIPALNEEARKFNLTGDIIVHSYCPPMLDLNLKDPEDFDEKTFNENVLRYISQHPDIHTVILAAAWSEYPSLDGLVKSVARLKKMHRDVVLIGDFPLLKNYENPRIFYLKKRFPSMYDISAFRTSRQAFDSANAPVFTLFDQLSRKWGIRVLRQDSALFEQNGLSIIEYKGIPLYRNGGHLSTFGSHYIERVFDNILLTLASNSSSGNTTRKNRITRS